MRTKTLKQKLSYLSLQMGRLQKLTLEIEAEVADLQDALDFGHSDRCLEINVEGETRRSPSEEMMISPITPTSTSTGRQGDSVREVRDLFLALRDDLGQVGRRPVLTGTRRAHIRARIKDHGLKTVLEATRRFLDERFWWASRIGFDGKRKTRQVAPELVYRSTEQMEKVLNAEAVRKPAFKGGSDDDSLTALN